MDPTATALSKEPDPLDAIIAAARHGDDGAVSTLFTTFQPLLLRYLHSQDSQAADDIAAEVWLGVARGLHRFEGGPDDFRVWFFGLARRRLADHRRRALRRPVDIIDSSEFHALPAPDSTEAQAIAALAGQETAAWIASVLSPDQTDVLMLRILASLDVDQVADLMGRSANWVRVTQHRALRHLERRTATKTGMLR